MILIADSGSTKTDWVLTEQKTIVMQCYTQGITPIHQHPDTIRQIMLGELLPQLTGKIPAETSLQVHFYGSGCTPTHIPMMEQLLAETFRGATVKAYSDLLGAARALCGREAGVACILGTGANSCLYDGNSIVKNTPAMGYILGDEGSGAVLGRLFLNAIFKNPHLVGVRDDFMESRQLTMADIIRMVYREPMANRFLASTSLYIKEHLNGNSLLRQLVVDNFRQFFRQNIVPYGRPDLSVGCVGSMAYHYQQQLEEAASAEGFKIGVIMKSPIDGLVAYHS